MDPQRRALYNAAFSWGRFAQLMNRLENHVGPLPFRLSETPLLLPRELRDRLVGTARELVAQLSEPLRVAHARKAIPARYDMPGMDELPNTAQVDLAIVEGAGGALEGRLVDLGCAPSFYGLLPVMGEAWAELLADIPGMDPLWSCFVGDDPPASLELIRRALLDGHDPEEVVVVIDELERPRTSPDLAATQRLFGVETECASRLEVAGDKVFRRRGGHRLRVQRLCNRMAFDALEARHVPLPFAWNQALDVSWCSHPNWSWVWSRYCLPFLSHAAAPRAQLLSDELALPADLSRFALRPLFADAAPPVDATREALGRVPAGERASWLLQEKVAHARAIELPDGSGLKAEVRVMFVRPPQEPALTPVLLRARLARAEAPGFDPERDATWAGAAVAMWPLEA